MQPLRLQLPGNYWDSQIYRGRLHLFDMNGDIVTVNWDLAINSMAMEHRLRLALVAGFLRSDFLYGAATYAVFQDPEVREVVQKKFEDLSRLSLHLTPDQLQRAVVGKQANRFAFPHADSEIYGKRLFVGSSRGVESATCGQQTKLPISTKKYKHTDIPVCGIAASYGTLALAAGEEGLFEVPVLGFQYDLAREPRHTSYASCEDCNWAFQSIYSTSGLGEGRLLQYERNVSARPISGRRAFDDDEHIERQLDAVVPAETIFGESGYSWGVQDKLCLAHDDAIRVVKYTPWDRRAPTKWKTVGVLGGVRPASQIVSACSAPFGFVVEYQDGLAVYPSTGEPMFLAGEPVSWRVFPRARYFENHLHVIYDDRLEVLSFNHDYFADQETKISGISKLLPDRDVKEAYVSLLQLH